MKLSPSNISPSTIFVIITTLIKPEMTPVIIILIVDTYSNQNENLVRSNIGINSSNNFDLRDNLRRRNSAAVSMIPSTTQRRRYLIF